MPQAPPITLGRFLVERDGRLSLLSEEAAPSFSFRWRGRLLRADMGAAGMMSLRVILGRVPSTASDRVVERRRSFDLMRALVAGGPDGWRIWLLPDHRAMLEVTVALPEPLTATRLLTSITGFLLCLNPYLDLVDEAGMPTGPH